MKLSADDLSFLNNYLMKDSMKWNLPKNVIDELIDIDQHYSDWPNKIGRMGEVYVAGAMRDYFQSRGFRYSQKPNPLTYKRRYQYRAGDATIKNGGIDMYLVLRDQKCKEYSIFLEICNWKAIKINDVLYHNRIKSKFERYDRLNRHIHMVAIPYHSKHSIEKYCRKDGIFILPMRGHITMKWLKYKRYV
jgi:hypothetical protein